MEFIVYLFKLLIFILFAIVLLYLSIKLNKNNSIIQSNKKYLNVIEKINIDKDNSFLVLKIGEEGCVVSMNTTNTTKIKDLSKEEVQKIEQMQIENQERINEKINENLKKINFEKLKELNFKNLKKAK